MNWAIENYKEYAKQKALEITQDATMKTANPEIKKVEYKSGQKDDSLNERYKVYVEINHRNNHFRISKEIYKNAYSYDDGLINFSFDLKDLKKEVEEK